MIIERDMAEKLTGDPSVGIGELAADDDPIHLRLVKLAAGIVQLAEEVTDEPLGTFVQGLEVGGELSVDVPTEIKNQSEIRSKEQHW